MTPKSQTPKPLTPKPEPLRPQPRSSPHPMAAAMTWVARVFAVAMEMVLPGVAGAYGDHYFGVSFLALLGFAIGIPLGVYHLVVMTRADAAKNKSPHEGD